ncbi:hypothetical protein AVEN_103627-1 [Araneus ventricosus]|uniref:Uncharacterized protein n=1 Tax=Araneus ventricosus TaxID=182803 RepID=A0A4Y2HBH3_ARAVE|nr:hypothetical protein AVEN_103627-1 [Araneus ventricosus]
MILANNGSLNAFGVQKNQELSMCSPYMCEKEKEMERLRKLLAEVETDEDPDSDNDDYGPEDVLEENFSDHGSFSKHDTESEEDRHSE